MADGNEHFSAGRVRHGIKFDPTINLGHIATAVVFLTTASAGWVALDARAARNEQDIKRAEVIAKESLSRAELELSRRIVEQRQYITDTQVNTAADIREIKVLMREGFKAIEDKMERKVDKPGR